MALVAGQMVLITVLVGLVVVPVAVLREGADLVAVD